MTNKIQTKTKNKRMGQKDKNWHPTNFLLLSQRFIVMSFLFDFCGTLGEKILRIYGNGCLVRKENVWIDNVKVATFFWFIMSTKEIQSRIRTNFIRLAWDFAKYPAGYLPTQVFSSVYLGLSICLFPMSCHNIICSPTVDFK